MSDMPDNIYCGHIRERRIWDKEYICTTAPFPDDTEYLRRVVSREEARETLKELERPEVRIGLGKHTHTIRKLLEQAGK